MRQSRRFPCEFSSTFFSHCGEHDAPVIGSESLHITHRELMMTRYVRPIAALKNLRQTSVVSQPILASSSVREFCDPKSASVSAAEASCRLGEAMHERRLNRSKLAQNGKTVDRD